MEDQIREELKGLTAEEFFEKQFRGWGIGFENILFHNRHIDFFPETISLAGKVTRNIKLPLPLVSAPMDTVTGDRMARAMSEAGGIGIIHAKFDAWRQKREVGKVKRRGLIVEPLVLAPYDRLEKLEAAMRLYSHIPVTEDGTPRGKLVGMVTPRIRQRPDAILVRDCLEAIDGTARPYPTVRKDNICMEDGTVHVSKALVIMETRKVRSLPVVDEENHLVGLLVARDLESAEENNPCAARDDRGRLRVGAAISTYSDDYERRVPLLVESGIDVLCVDTAQGDSLFMIKTLEWIKKHYPAVEVIAGNISVAEGALRLIEAGADALRVGNGSGGVCTTQPVTRTGATQPAAIYRTASVASPYGIPVIADGGIRNAGDIVTALALGAHTVMLGTFVAALPESAAPLRTVVIDGKSCVKKLHRGMASRGALEERVVARYEDGKEKGMRAPEGEEIYLEPSQKNLSEFMQEVVAWIKQSFCYLGVRNIDELHARMRGGEIRLEYVPYPKS